MSPNTVVNEFKVALVGDCAVGKSTILSILMGESFSSCYVKTKERVIKTKDIVLGNGKKKRLQIWDTAGADECRTYTTHSIKDVKAIVVVVDVCNEDSFLNVQHWLKVINNYVDNAEDSLVTVIVANKIDKIKYRKVQTEQIQQLADQYSVKHLEVSAKSNTNIDTLFQMIAREIDQKAKEPIFNHNDEDEEYEEPDKRFFDNCVLL